MEDNLGAYLANQDSYSVADEGQLNPDGSGSNPGWFNSFLGGLSTVASVAGSVKQSLSGKTNAPPAKTTDANQPLSVIGKMSAGLKIGLAVAGVAAIVAVVALVLRKK